MFKFQLFGTLIIILMYGGDLTENFCPTYCKCDMYEKYKRATCKSKRLISVDAEIPTKTEILDLSCNLIYELGDHIFLDLQLSSLKLLNLSYNKISQIHMNAFSNMNNVKTIDLSNNNVEYLLENWFWDLPQLEELYLRSNNLRKLREGPILESKSMKILDLSECGLLHIHDDAFSKLSNLEILNLSGNNLIQFDVSIIKPLNRMKVLALQNNPWKCNDLMISLTKYLKRNGITSKNLCTKRSVEKFQRMMVESTTTELPVNNWLFNEDSIQENTTQSCINVREDASKGLLLEIMELSPILTLIVPFLFGLLIGLMTTCCIFTLLKPKPKPKSKKLRRDHRNSIIRNRRLNDFLEHPLVQPDCFEICDSTPMPLRKNILHNSGNSFS